MQGITLAQNVLMTSRLATYLEHLVSDSKVPTYPLQMITYNPDSAGDWVNISPLLCIIQNLWFYIPFYCYYLSFTPSLRTLTKQKIWVTILWRLKMTSGCHNAGCFFILVSTRFHDNAVYLPTYSSCSYTYSIKRTVSFHCLTCSCDKCSCHAIMRLPLIWNRRLSWTPGCRCHSSVWSFHLTPVRESPTSPSAERHRLNSGRLINDVHHTPVDPLPCPLCRKPFHFTCFSLG